MKGCIMISSSWLDRGDFAALYFDWPSLLSEPILCSEIEIELLEHLSGGWFGSC